MTAFLFIVVLLAPPAAAAEPAPLDEARAAYASFDHARAVELLRPLAHRGNVQAQRMLGWMYNNGQGVERDEREAARWYCECCMRWFPGWSTKRCAWAMHNPRHLPGAPAR